MGSDIRMGGLRLLLALLVDRHAGRLGLVQPLQLADESHRVKPTPQLAGARRVLQLQRARELGRVLQLQRARCATAGTSYSRHQRRASTRLCTRLASASAGKSMTSWTRARCPCTSPSTSPGSSLPRTRTQACLLRRCFGTSPLLSSSRPRTRTRGAPSRRSLPVTSSCRPSSQATCLRTTFATLSPTLPLLRRQLSSGTL